MKVWTPERIKRAIEVLRATPKDRLHEACAVLSQEFGFNVTRDAVEFGIRRYGGTTLPRELGLDVEAARLAAEDVGATQRMPAMSVEEAARVLDAADDQPPIAATPATESAPRTVHDDLAEHRLRQRLTAAEARTKALLDELAATKDELASYKTIDRAGRALIEVPKKVGGMQRVGVPLMMCSDWHVEEPVDPKKVNGINEYNLDIAEECIAKLATSFAGMVDDSPRFDCRTAVIALMGDLISGTIHDELLESNFLSPQRAQVWLLDRLEGMLRTILALCPNLDRIIVPCNSGNHGRATHKQRVSTREDNSLEMVVYQTLARIFRDEPRLEFVFADGEWIELDVMGYQIAITHGDSFNYGGGIAGMMVPIRRGITRQFAGRNFHQYLMGHFHKRTDDGDVQINGSLIGYGAYSMRLHAKPEPRQQAWFMIDKDRGKSITAPIWLPKTGLV